VPLFLKEMRGRYRVADLMHYAPVTVFDYTPLARVVEEMRAASVKRVLVLSGETLTGIISVHDLSIVLFQEKKLCRHPTSSDITAADLMTKDPVTISRRADAADAASIMVERAIGGIPVIEARHLGLISRVDLLKGYQVDYSRG